MSIQIHERFILTFPLTPFITNYVLLPSSITSRNLKRSISLFIFAAAILLHVPALAHDVKLSPRIPPGHPHATADSDRAQQKISRPVLSSVRKRDGIVLLELAESGFTPENLLDLEGTTLTITPDGQDGFTSASGPLQWESDFGTPIDADDDEGFPSTLVDLQGFQFPFDGQLWAELYVNAFGTISFGAPQTDFHSTNSVQDRFFLFNNFGNTLAARGTPLIAVLFRKLAGGFTDPQDINEIFVKEDEQGLLVTWSMSERYSDIQDFITSPQINQFQARLFDDGSIKLSYLDLFVEDAIVGVFDPLECGGSQPISDVIDDADLSLPEHIDITRVEVLGEENCALEFRITVRGNTLPEGDPSIEDLFYRVFIDLDTPFFSGNPFEEADLSPGVAVDQDLKYVPSGDGATDVTVSGNQVSFRLPLAELGQSSEIGVFVDAVDFDGSNFDSSAEFTGVPPQQPDLEQDLSGLAVTDTLPSTFFEPFHYALLPSFSELLCEALPVTGDRFDMLAFYTDFRIDTQEAGARSSGPIGDSVTGIGQAGRDPATFCSGGELEVFQQSVSVNTPIAMRTVSIDGEVFGEFAPQIALMLHELGHRWLAYITDVQTADGTVTLSDPIHWFGNVHAPSPGAVTESMENSPMGGDYWVDNGDGTFSSPGNEFFFPPTAYSYMDLYLMGLIAPAEVPDFFVIENLEFAGFDFGGEPIWAGNRIDVTIDDVIGAAGLRQPPAGTQTQFDLGLIGIVKPGQLPSSELITRLNGIGQAFEPQWHDATAELSTIQTDTNDIILHHGFE